MINGLPYRCIYRDEKKREKENKSLDFPLPQDAGWLASQNSFRLHYFIGCPSTEKLIIQDMTTHTKKKTTTTAEELLSAT
jgi:hypothetical protein